MTETEKIVRIFHESWDMRDPDRGATVIAMLITITHQGHFHNFLLVR